MHLSPVFLLDQKRSRILDVANSERLRAHGHESALFLAPMDRASPARSCRLDADRRARTAMRCSSAALMNAGNRFISPPGRARTRLGRASVARTSKAFEGLNSRR